MITNPKIGQKVWFFEPWGQCIHSAKITALDETEASVRDQERYPYADIKWDDGGDSIKRIRKINYEIRDVNDLVTFMYNHCVASAEEYTDWIARRAVKEIAKEMLGLEL